MMHAPPRDQSRRISRRCSCGQCVAVCRAQLHAAWAVPSSASVDGLASQHNELSTPEIWLRAREDSASPEYGYAPLQLLPPLHSLSAAPLSARPPGKRAALQAIRQPTPPSAVPEMPDFRGPRLLQCRISVARRAIPPAHRTRLPSSCAYNSPCAAAQSAAPAASRTCRPL
eukprot:4876425-Prymnesium_polylepis.3